MIGEKKLSDSNVLIIVLSRNYSTGLGIIRSLGSAGYTVDLIASVRKKGSSVIASCSRYVRRSCEVMADFTQGDPGTGILDALREYEDSTFDKKVIFPADDYTASVVDANRDMLKKHFIIPDITGTVRWSVSDVMDKSFQSRMAAEAGLAVPMEWMVSLRDDMFIPEDIVYPCFVKPLQSITGQKKEMCVCRDEEQLLTHLKEMKDFYDDRSVLIQEYLDIDREYDLSGVCLDQDVIIPAVIEKIRISGHERGVTMAGKMVPVSVLGDSFEKIVSMLRGLGYRGMFDMELNLCGNRLLFNEINLRSGGPSFAYYLNGVNLPAILVKELTGSDHSDEAKEIATFGKSFVYEKVAWEDYIYSYMSRSELHRCLKEADFTLLANSDDPMPGRCFARRIRLSAVKRRIMELKAGRRHGPELDDGDITAKDCVLITGRNYGNILTMTRDLGQAGYAVDILRVFTKKPGRTSILSSMKPEAYSRYVRNFQVCIEDGNVMNVISALEKMSSGESRQLLMPVDDHLVDIADRNYDRLSRSYIIPNAGDKAGGIIRLMNKSLQKEIATGFGMPMLKSWLIIYEGGSFIIPDDITYPCFIKPNVSRTGTKKRMARCDGREELEAAIGRYEPEEGLEILAEEFADIKHEYSLLGISTDSIVEALGLFRVVEGGSRERKGVALTGEMIPCSYIGSVMGKCLEFIRSLDYTGLFDVDFIETSDGHLYFVEINFRAGASARALTASGVDLPGIFADHVLGKRRADSIPGTVAVGGRFINEKVLMEEYARSGMAISGVRKRVKQADIHFIRDEHDHRPYRYFRRYYAVAALMKLPYRLRDHLRKRS